MKLNSVSLFKLSVGIFLLNHSTILSASITTLTDNDSTFHAMIAPYIYCTEEIHANDTSIYENMGFPNLLPNPYITVILEDAQCATQSDHQFRRRSRFVL